MCGRVVILFLLLVSSFPALAQCTWTLRDSAAFRTTALDLSIDGPAVWLATGYGVQLLEDRGTRVIDAIPLPGVTRVVRADRLGRAYVGSGTRLYVLQREGNALRAAHFVELTATINDILIADQYLFVATAAGLLHMDIVDPLAPNAPGTLLFTSAANVTSLALAGGKLYAADGDNTVDVFSMTIPSIPQRTGEITSSARATAVHASLDGTLLISDAFGQNTDVVTGTTTIGRLPIGSSSFAAGAGGVNFVAGPDRTLRAVDFTSTSTLKELFEHQLAPTGGTDNVIHALARSGDTLYVAAGDIGLVIFDTATVAAPYPLVSYRTSRMTSTVTAGDRAWFADGSGTITEQRIVSTGLALTSERTWTGGAAVHDVEGTTLLTSSNATTTLWSLTGSAPTSLSTSTFRAAVRFAAIRGDNVVALLVDGSVWLGGPAPQQVVLPTITQAAKEGNGLLFVELGERTTILHHFATGDLAAAPQRITVNGIATGGVAFDGSRAAVFTFTGINVIDLASGTARVIAGSDRTIPRQLSFAGNDLLVLDTRTLLVYDDARTLVREHFLPADGLMMDANAGLAVLATAEGMLATAFRTASPQRTIPFASTFYTKMASGADRLYLFAPGAIDFYAMQGDAPVYLTGIRSSGSIDLAASNDTLFTLTGAGVVSAFSRSGALLRQTTLNEGPDAQPLAIDVAGGAVWVSFSKGCQTGACEQKTLVLDPATLNLATSLSGGVKDVVTSGTQAYALFDFPSEVRIIDITSPLAPAVVKSAAAAATSTSVAFAPGRVYVIGDRLYEHSATSLEVTATHFTPLTPDKAQQVRVDGQCLVVSARSSAPELYGAPALTAAGTVPVPAAVRSITTHDGRLLILTTHSLEIWSNAAPEPRKRRSVR